MSSFSVELAGKLRADKKYGHVGITVFRKLQENTLKLFFLLNKTLNILKCSDLN